VGSEFRRRLLLKHIRERARKNGNPEEPQLLSVLDRALDKPAEQVKMTGFNDEPVP
jgi:hypothetical protein